MKTIYHKIILKRLMKDYLNRLSNLDCGRELAKYIFGWSTELENKMDKHIKAINQLNNKKFTLFSEGYVPSGVFN